MFHSNMLLCTGREFETATGLERLILRPLGRRYTTVAIFRAAAMARRVATGLLGIGLDMDILSIVGGSARPSSFLDDLLRLGVSRAGSLNYEAAVAEGRALLIVHGRLADTNRAACLLAQTVHLGLAEYRG